MQNVHDNSFRAARVQCESTTCAHMPDMENDNCVNQCISANCYETVFGAEPVRV